MHGYKKRKEKLLCCKIFLNYIMKKLLFIFLFFFSNAHAAFLINTMSSFSSSSDSYTSTKLSDMSNHIFLGASIGAKQRAYIGQNISILTNQVQTSATNKINTLELGPRVTYFFSDENVFYTTLGWNPYAKGKRTVSGTTEDVSGWAFLAGIGAELKIDRSFHIGASLNYHSLTITKSISASNVATTVSDKYSSILPMINLSLRFR